MNRRLSTILLAAFLIAAGASYVVYRLVGKQIRGGSKRPVAVIVATRDLEIGTVVKAADIKTGDYIGNLPKDAVVKPDTAIGRGVITPIYAGEPVIEKRLAPAGSGGGMAATIPPGMRACAVKVNDVVGLAGFVTPGMHVDVLVSGSSAGTRTPAETKVRTLLQDIEVLSAGKNFQHDNEGKPIEVQVVNLLVTPEQAELLSLASNETRIQLVLRNPIDHQVATPPGTELARIFGGEPAHVPAPASAAVEKPARPRPAPVAKAEPPKPEPPPQHVVHVMNGARVTEQKFQLEPQTETESEGGSR